MSSKRLISVSLSLLVFLTGCQKSEKIEPTVDVTPQKTGGDNSAWSLVLRRRMSQADVDPESMSVAQNFERLRIASAIFPDKRFLQAIAAVNHLATGHPVEAVDAQFNNHVWTVKYQNQVVGVLPELPGFAAMYELLFAYAKSMKQPIAPDAIPEKAVALGELEKQVNECSPESLFAVLRESEKHWQSGMRSGRFIKLSARALALLSWQSLDTLQIGDDVFINALALIAYAEAAQSEQLQEAKALIADGMGYVKGAQQLTSTLPKDSVIGAFVNRRISDLELKAKSENGIARAIYFRLVCEERHKDKWRQWLDSHKSTSAANNLTNLKSVFCMHREESMLPVALQVLGSVRKAVSAENASSTLNSADIIWDDASSKLPTVASLLAPNLLADFEKSMENGAFESVKGASSEGTRNALFTTAPDELRRAFYRGYFFSAIDIIARTTLALPSARVFSERLAACLEYKGSGVSSQLAPWVAALYTSTQNADSEVESALMSLNLLGPSAVIELLLQNNNLLNSSKFSTIRDLFFVRVDSRPTNRLALAEVAELPFIDLITQQSMISAAVRDGLDNSSKSFMYRAKIAGDFSFAMKSLKNPATTLSEKLQILSLLRSIGSAGGKGYAVLLNAYGTVQKEYPSSWDAMRQYADFLKQTDLPKSITEVKNWIDKFGKNHSENLTQHLYLAQLLYEQKAFKALKAELKSLPSNPAPLYLKLLALCELGLNNIGSAKAWAEEYRRSYPRSLDALLIELDIALSQRQIVPAANILAPFAQTPRIIWKEKIGAIIISRLPNEQDVGSFIGALRSVGIDSDDNVGQIAAAAYSADKPGLAFQILSVVKENPESLYDMRVCQYRYLKRAEGKAKAIEWLKQEITENNRFRVAPYAFISGQDELLFEFAPIEDSIDAGEQIWLLRTASGVLHPLTEDWKTQLFAHFEGRKDFVGTLGLFLLGKVDRSAVEKLPLTSEQRAQVSFYIAWKEMVASGNFDRDVAYLLVCLSTNQVKLAEYEWSKIWLRDIASTLHEQPFLSSGNKLQRLHLIAPKQDGAWSEQRRFKLSIQ